jgi:hypothetical protein
MSVTGAIIGTEGASAAVSSPFQVANCANLAFKPKFAASTSGKTSKADGASLKVKLTFPGATNSGSSGSSSSGNGPSNGQANVAYVKVQLPKALPSRLTTLQKACTAQVFDSNPAGCPSASMVGTAIARTPILNNPLTGPAYFVSRGNEAFPQLIMVLQGEGIVIDLVGDTSIKNGVTSSTFAHVPDAPVSSFELNLPQGKYSALAANGNLCQQKLVMPTAFVAQNGAALDQSTHIEVEGCSNTLSVVSSKVKKKTLTLKIYVPSSGKVKVSGKGLSSTSKSSGGRETVTVVVHQKKAGRLKTKVSLRFTPSKGKGQSKNLAVKFKK